jgi:hypothetical protein
MRQLCLLRQTEDLLMGGGRIEIRLLGFLRAARFRQTRYQYSGSETEFEVRKC